jgi:hypothetical protein
MKTVIQNATAFCDVFNLFWWRWRQTIIRIIYFYELILKPAFLLLLRYVSIMCSSFVCGQQLFQVLKLLNIHSKIFEKFLPFIFQTSKLNWNSPSSSLARDTLWIQYFHSGAQPKGKGLPGCSPHPNLQNRNKKTGFVDTMISNLFSDSPFSRNQPPKSAHDSTVEFWKINVN